MQNDKCQSARRGVAVCFFAYSGQVRFDSWYGDAEYLRHFFNGHITNHQIDNLLLAWGEGREIITVHANRRVSGQHA